MRLAGKRAGGQAGRQAGSYACERILRTRQAGKQAGGQAGSLKISYHKCVFGSVYLEVRFVLGCEAFMSQQFDIKQK